ncbi:MAG: CPBP family glutamic-type intramembrane protease [Pseudomonadota bacterium]
MLTLAVIASTILLTGVEIPDNTLNEMALTPSWIAVIVIGAPLTEELMFRSWLSGRPGHLIAGLLIGASIVALPALTAATPGNDVYVSAALGAVLAICVFSLWRWRRSPPFKWFSRLFPVIFWLVALSFALIHLINYEAASLLVLLPLVIPQLIAGTLFGYARVQYGLWASIMLHALHNGSAVVAMLIAQANAPAGAG